MKRVVKDNNSLIPDDNLAVYFEITKLLTYTSIRDIKHSDCHRAVENYLRSKEHKSPKDRIKSYDRCMKILKQGLDVLIPVAKIKESPLVKIVPHVDHESVIRSHLTKKSLTSKEESSLYSELSRDDYADPLSFGAAIMLFTGMTVQEVCGLQFGDIRHISVLMATKPEGPFEIPKDDEEYIIAISRVYRNLLGVYKVTNMVESQSAFRIIPVNKMCKHAIERRVRYLMGQGVEFDKIADMPVVCKTGNAHNSLQTPCHPDKLTAFVKRILLSLNIKQQDLYIPVIKTKPSGKQKTENTRLELKINLRLLRSHFEYRAKHVCQLSDSEINYFLGRACQDVTSRHYREFRELFNQFALLQKLNRWIISDPQQGSDKNGIQQKDGTKDVDSSFFIDSVLPQNMAENAAVCFDVVGEPGKSISLDLSCLKGMNGTIIISTEEN